MHEVDIFVTGKIISLKSAKQQSSAEAMFGINSENQAIKLKILW
jgi:hypothetical protein